MIYLLVTAPCFNSVAKMSLNLQLQSEREAVAIELHGNQVTTVKVKL